MRKEHIRKKKEAKWKASLPPVTNENMDDYPIGNPFRKKISKAEIKQMSEFVRAYREANPIPEKVKLEIEEMRKSFIEEDRKLELIKKKKQVRRLFFK